MGEHKRFRYKSLEQMQADIAALGLDIRFDSDVSVLGRPVQVGQLTCPNALCIHPMEGCDALLDGRPGPLMYRRYERYARGGAGLIWFEATAVSPEGRDTTGGLILDESTVADFARLHEETLRAARESVGHTPLTVLQLAHSGRYTKDVSGRPTPMIAFRCPHLDPRHNLPPDYPILSDERLEELEDCYVRAAELAWQAGFPMVDIKACHRYFLSELLAAHTRPGRYGGPFENRVRFLLNVVDRIRDRVPGLGVTTRLNLFDAIPYPYGWGSTADDPPAPDLSEPLRLVGLLRERGVRMVNVSIGNPYYNPHFGRPFDTPIIGAYLPPEHPLEGVHRLFHLARRVQEAYPDMVIVGTGYSWLRQYLGAAGAANVRNGWCRMVGVGREAFAYPGFARALLEDGSMAPDEVCIACSSCTQIMRDGGTTGCVPRDREIYGPIFKEFRKGKPGPTGRPAVRLHF